MADYLKTADVWTVLDLIVAEFKSDPTSVQCFDRRIVERAIELIANRPRFENPLLQIDATGRVSMVGETPGLSDRADVDLVLLALAILSLDRPGWLEACRAVAAKIAAERPAEELQRRHAFEEFRRLNADRWQERPLV